MNKALQGILATHGAAETITQLFNLLHICVTTGGPLCGMEAARGDMPNDLEYLNHLMENFPLLDENGAELALNTESPWRVAADRGRLEAAADEPVLLKII